MSLPEGYDESVLSTLGMSLQSRFADAIVTNWSDRSLEILDAAREVATLHDHTAALYEIRSLESAAIFLKGAIDSFQLEIDEEKMSAKSEKSGGSSSRRHETTGRHVKSKTKTDDHKIKGKGKSKVEDRKSKHKSERSSKGHASSSSAVSRLEELRDRREELKRDLEHARTERDTRILEIGDDMADQQHAAWEAFDKYISVSTVVLEDTDGKPVSLLPELSPAYASALASYGGDWPPTIENISAYIETRKASESLLSRRENAQRIFAKKCPESVLLERSTNIEQEPIDLYAPAISRYLKVADRDAKYFNDVILAESKLREDDWDTARLEEWLWKSKRKPYSTLESDLATYHPETGHLIDGSYQEKLMRQPRAISEQDINKARDVSKTMSPIWTSPPSSYSWCRTVRPPRGDLSESESEEEVEQTNAGKGKGAAGLEDKMMALTVYEEKAKENKNRFFTLLELRRLQPSEENESAVEAFIKETMGEQ